MFRLVSLAFASWVSLFVAVLNDEAKDSAPPPTTTTEVAWSGNPLIIQPLSADSHESEESIPQVPAIPNGVTYEGEGGPEPTSHYLSSTTTTLVPLPVWEGSIPEVYGEGSGCSQAKANIIARAMWDRGANDDSVKNMLRIISRESLCDSSAHNGNTRTRDDSWGLCQQNNLSGWFNEGKLLENYDRFAFADDFAYNAESCAVMWAECGVGPWNYGNYYCSTPRELR